jgi:hypothetical protein
MRQAIVLVMASLLFGACGQQGGSSQGTSPGAFRVWSVTTSAYPPVDLSGKFINWTAPFVNANFPNCTYEFRVEGTPSFFTFKTVDVTSPADPTCFDYSVADEMYTFDGATLNVCLINGTNCREYTN